MTGITTTWLDSELCPACGTGLHLTDGGTTAITQHCPACGWTASYDMAGQSGGGR
jgi:uncharacterized protein (DUF983 family)